MRSLFIIIGQDDLIFYHPSILTFVLGDQKNSLIETVLLSTHNICFGSEFFLITSF